jgi:hypothetical protein
MIRPLRKYHYYIWRILLMVLTLTFALSLLWRPNTKTESAFTDDFRITTHMGDSSFVLKIMVLNPIRHPSCGVYGSTASGEIFLGMLDKRDMYTFTSKTPFTEVLLIDKLHGRIILEKSLAEK